MTESTNNGSQCFYTLCDKTKCCKCIPFGKFKDRKHAMYCYLFISMMICLFIAVIGPLVSIKSFSLISQIHSLINIYMSYVFNYFKGTIRYH